MNFYLIGIDHNGASLEIREALHKKRKAIDAFLAQRFPGRHAVLSTCNRIEIYGSARNTKENEERLGAFLKHFPEFSRYGYAEMETGRILTHLVRLASGLKSQVKGEVEILQQLDVLHQSRSFPEELFGLWRNAIRLGRYIRLETGLNDGGRNIASVIFGDILASVNHDRRIKVAVIGTGKIASLFALNNRSEIKISFMANKNHKRAEVLASLANGEALSMEDLPKLIATADVIISATKSPHFIIKGSLPGIRKRITPLYIYDLAVPRDVDPQIGSIDGVILKDTGKLAALFERFNRQIEDRLNLAEYMAEEAAKYETGDLYGMEIENRNTAEHARHKTG